MNDPKRQVVVAMIATAIVATINGGPISPPRYVALLFIYMILALLVEVAPPIAVPLAWLIFVVMLFTDLESFKVFAKSGAK